MSEACAIHVEHVVKDFSMGDGHLRVLHDINLDIRSGELTYLVGESGSGKTTLISIIAAFSTRPKAVSACSAPISTG